MAIEASDDVSVRTRFEGDMADEPGGQGRRRSPVALALFRERASRAPQVWG